MSLDLIGLKTPPDGIITKMAAPKEINLSALYVELNRFGQNGEYERALKTANKSKATRVLAYGIVVQLTV
jgi:hypothetical protein